MTAGEKIAHWSFQLITLGLLGALACIALLVVVVQVWVIVYWNPWGFSLFPLRETALTIVSGIIVCMAVSFIGMAWNTAP